MNYSRSNLPIFDSKNQLSLKIMMVGFIIGLGGISIFFLGANLQTMSIKLIGLVGVAVGILAGFVGLIMRLIQFFVALGSRPSKSSFENQKKG